MAVTFARSPWQQNVGCLPRESLVIGAAKDPRAANIWRQLRLAFAFEATLGGTEAADLFVSA